MFDFFRDMTMVYRGIDVEAAHEQDLENKERQKQEYALVPIFLKRIIYIFGGIYIAGAAASIMLMAASDAAGGQIARSAVLMCIDIAAIMLLAMKKKKTELSGLVCVAAFFVLIVLFYT